MEANKKYYWLKLKRDFFKRHDIMIIESMPNGKEYALFYLKLLLESIDHEGALRFSEAIPYNEQMISTITNTNIDIVRTAMKIFQQLNLVEMQDNQTIFMNEVNKMLGSETAYAEKQRQYRLNRDKKDTLSTACLHRVRQEIELEKEIELDKYTAAKPKKESKPKRVTKVYGEFRNVKLTDDELKKLQDKWIDWNEKLEIFSNDKELHGYKYTNDYLALLKWRFDEIPTNKPKPKQEQTSIFNDGRRIM